MHNAGAAGHPGPGDARTRFERMFTAHYEPILAYALRRTPTCDDAADVVAETFLTAWRRLEQAPEGEAVRLWLFGIARRVMANQLRTARRYERLGARLRAVPPSPADGDAPRIDERDLIAQAFGQLSADDREILTLVGVEGLSPGEAARVLGCSAVAARVRVHRARARFRRALAAQGVRV